MTFFNKKEDVLEIELTQFGKQLLSQEISSHIIMHSMMMILFMTINMQA